MPPRCTASARRDYSGLHLCGEVALGFPLPLGEGQGEGRLLIQLKTAVGFGGWGLGRDSPPVLSPHSAS
jgi:hypothetical protein